jgi:large subunit ribosomal protein L18
MNLKRAQEKERKLVARHQRIRKHLVGGAERPRLCVHRSLKNFSAQIIDDTSGKVLCGLSTLDKEFKSKVKTGGNVAGAMKLGEAFAAVAKGKGIQKVCFDRGGYLYHGRIKAFAEGARKGGLDF